MPTVRTGRLSRRVLVLGAFVEVFLAKEGHDGEVGMNLLTKVQLTNLPTLYGAMLAGVDWILMGAGIPREIPDALTAFAEGRSFSMNADVTGRPADAEPVRLTFDPAEFAREGAAPPKRPAFVPIIASHSLATMLAKRAPGGIQGFVVEGPTAGGHDAPPRGKAAYDAAGEPVYGERDVADLGKLRELGLPFWLAGGTGSPQELRDALDAGAAGIQVGTLFAYSDESGLDEDLKRTVLARTLAGETRIRTDPSASPTGFPFKVVSVPGTHSESESYESRNRVCDLGYLREAYVTPNGSVGYRCPSEPVDAYVAKGGREEDTLGRKCLCNALMADVGMPQIQKDGEVERALVTSGDALLRLDRFLGRGARSYGAGEVIDYLLGR